MPLCCIKINIPPGNMGTPQRRRRPAHALPLVISTGGPPGGPQWRDLAANRPCRHTPPHPGPVLARPSRQAGAHLQSVGRVLHPRVDLSFPRKWESSSFLKPRSPRRANGYWRRRQSLSALDLSYRKATQRSNGRGVACLVTYPAWGTPKSKACPLFLAYLNYPLRHSRLEVIYVFDRIW